MMGQAEAKRGFGAWAWAAGAAFYFLAASAFAGPRSFEAPRLVYEAAAASEGWDLRDEQNRPVSDASLRRELQAAALEAAYRSAFQADQPTTQAFLASLDEDLGGLRLRPEPAAARDVPDGAPGKRVAKAGASETGVSPARAPDLSFRLSLPAFEPAAGAFLRIPPVLLC